MRFWNVFVPITLVLVVAADIHYGELTCHDRGDNWMSGSWGVVPSGNDTCAAAAIIFDQEVEGQRCSFYGRDIAITASLCGKNVTILLNDSPKSDFFLDSDGRSGECVPLSGGVQTTQCYNRVDPEGFCRFKDRGYCPLPMCQPAGSGEAQ
ncbi:uncharacterized protein EI90DRAFT_3077047 [Cantharellus anzutake]|uniref:uncharacterized protein n=1 Tax=Cantharellus anzutake TaxID=1750568 RepID=UPI001904B58A|nr:uncharacterized protein EI90DRAFT_3077047 [Cantharellus anzutake]KAF8322976.1 hypothetical protein EI90DRAFT_3077047 [Cantharellus anzutake]